MSDMLAGVVVALAAVGYVLQPLLRSGRPVPGRAAAATAIGPVCAECGVRPEADAVFCSNCGKPLGEG